MNFKHHLLWSKAIDVRRRTIVHLPGDWQPIQAGPADDKRDVIAIVADVEIVAAEAPKEGESAKPPTFSVKAYNGGALPLNYWDYPVVVDLAGMTFARNISANLHHETQAIVGHVTEPTTDGKSLTLNGVVSGTGEGAQEFIGNARNGYPWQASIEASPLTKPDFIGEDASVEVNGRTIKGPVYVVRKSQLYGIAFLPRGADDRTSVKIAAGAAQESAKMDPKFKAWLIEMGINPETITPEQLVRAEANYKGLEAPPKPPTPPQAAIHDTLAAARAEQDRQQAIHELMATTLADPCNVSRGRDFIDGLETLTQQAIDAKWPIEKYDTELLRATRPQAHPVFQTRSRDDRLTNDVLQAALCMAGGLNNLDKKFTEPVLQAAHSRFPNGIGLREIIDLAARAHGYRGDGWEITLEKQQYAFGMVPRQIQAGFSTLSLPGIFGDTLNKFLLEGWGASDMAWGDIASRRNVRDFKTVSSYRLGGNFKYIKVGPTGEIKQGTFSEDTYTNKAETYGIRVALTRTDYVNDDLGALSQVPREMGFGAADSLNEVFWTEFLNNSAFFVAGNNNVSTGVLNLANLAVAEAVFMAQTKPNGQPLAVVPRILLVPSALYRTALTAMNSNIVIDGSATALQGNVNTFAGNFKVVTSPFMSNASFTGNSAVAWYLLADPARLAVIEVAFLNGKESPTIEDAVAESNVLGFTIRGYHDWGCNLQEPRAGVRSTGA